MKLQEFYQLLRKIYAKHIYLAEGYKHLYDYIDKEVIKAYAAIDRDDIEQDIFILFAIINGIEKAIYKNLPEFIRFHEEYHNKTKEAGRNTRKESARHRFFYAQANFYLCVAQNNCKKCKSFNICPLVKAKYRKVKINARELERKANL